MRIIFAGTPEFAASHLGYLLDHTGHSVVTVLTQPDRPAGRGQRLTPSPVKELALARHLPVLQPTTLKSADIQEQLQELQPDVMVVVAYGLILPVNVLATPRFGCLNVHASLLPRWRGAAPIQRAIEAGDSQTGITIMQMDAGLDTGDMLLKVSCPITPDETAATLHDKLMRLGGPALSQVLDQISQHKISPEKQDEQNCCYASKISKAEAQIHWSDSAESICRKIRAFNPFPIAFFKHREEAFRVYECLPLAARNTGKPGEIMAISTHGIDVATGEGWIRIIRLQLPGKKAMAASEVLNGHPDLFKTRDCLD